MSLKNIPNNINYVMVFDLDETLGHFSQLYVFWVLFIKYINNTSEMLFFKILDSFPKFLRPNILTILKNIRQKKQQNICNYVMIYTNNTGPKSWTNMIKKYFHYKLKYQLFDKIIGAFKVNGHIVEVCRTSQGKSVKDFINCSHLPPNSKICFLDDQNHPEMHNKNVLYIKLKPHTYNIDFSVMASKIYDKMNNYFPKNKSKEDFMNYIATNTQNSKLEYLNKSNSEYGNKRDFTNTLIKKINAFFDFKPRKFTKKIRNYKSS
jgi:hypothetical protein